MTPDSDAAARLDALLAEGTWLKRLARGLLADPAKADDLAQDVLAAALARRPALQGAPLRGWLATVARRIAGRARERGVARVRAERRAARPEDVQRDALTHLELHRRVAAAILALDEPYRTAVLQRYLEDLPPRAIAARLGISETAARKRVSRGLARLRERLDADEARDAGGSASWALAAASLARGAGVEAIAPDAGLASNASAQASPAHAQAPPAPAQASPASAQAPPASAQASGAPSGPPIARRGLSELVRGLRSAAHPAGASSAPLVPILALVTSKLALLLLIAGAAAAAVLWVARDRGATSARSDALAVAHADGELAHASGAEDGVVQRAAGASEQEARTALAASPSAGAATVAPRVRVVDEAGAPVANAKAAWIDFTHEVHALELDDEASAPLPDIAQGQLFYAGAEGYATAWMRDPDGPQDAVVLLERGAEVRGRIVEDGGVPIRPILVRVLRDLEGLDNTVFTDTAVRAGLARAGVMPGLEWSRTAPDGSFALPRFRRGTRALVSLAGTHRVLRVEGGERAVTGGSVFLISGAPEAVIYATRLPSVRGRLVWADDGTAVRGELDVSFTEGSGNGYLTGATIDEGEFEIGIPVTEEDLSLAPERRRILHKSLTISFRGGDDRRTPGFAHTVSLDPAALPLDLGVLRVPVAPTLALRVLDERGAPVPRAAVGSSLARALTDEEGRVRLAVAPPEVVQVLAIGYALARVDVERAGSEGELEVRLAQGISLAVHPADDATRALPVRVAWERTPFQGAGPDGPLPAGLHRMLLGGSYVVAASHNANKDGMPGWIKFPFPVEGDLVLAGLEPGSTLTISVDSAFDQALGAIDVVLPETPGEHRVELRAPSDAGMLRVLLFDEAGRELPGGRVLVSANRRGTSFEADSHVVEVGPLPFGTYDLEAAAQGRMPLKVGGYELVPGAPALELRLQPARTVHVRVEDETGRELRPRSLRVEAADGWSAPAQITELDRFPVTAPLGPLEAVAEVGTRTYRAPIPAGDAQPTDAVVRVPRHARVRIELDAIPALQGDFGDLSGRLHEVDGTGEAKLWLGFWPHAPGPLALDLDLLPGVYDLELDLEEWLGEHEDDLPLVRAIARRRIEVDADATIAIPITR